MAELKDRETRVKGKFIDFEYNPEEVKKHMIWLHEAIKDRRLDLSHVIGETVPQELGGFASAVHDLSYVQPSRYLSENQGIRDRLGRKVAGRFNEHKERPGYVFGGSINHKGQKLALLGGVYSQGKRTAVRMGTAINPDGQPYFFYQAFKGNQVPPVEQMASIPEERFTELVVVKVPDKRLPYLSAVIEDLQEGQSSSR